MCIISGERTRRLRVGTLGSVRARRSRRAGSVGARPETLSSPRSFSVYNLTPACVT